MAGDQRRAWQLPRGVSAGTWDYVVEPTVASQYEAFHGDHPLMQLDMELLMQRLVDFTPATTLVADFGCGTGRVARHLAELGYRTLNVDLSRHMLKTAAESLPSTGQSGFVHSNLVELEWLADASLDVAVCLFSSVGMIRGRDHRIRFLQHVHRTLKPGGFFLLHVHNRGRSWLDPKGPWWLISGKLKSWFNQDWESGDRIYVYRGLPRMFLHVYKQSELRSDMLNAGFDRMIIDPIDVSGSRLLRRGKLFNYFHAGGFFARASKS